MEKKKKTFLNATRTQSARTLQYYIDYNITLYPCTRIILYSRYVCFNDDIIIVSLYDYRL